MREDDEDIAGAFHDRAQGPLTASTVRKLTTRGGELAKNPFPVHPYAPRHACGFKLANDGNVARP